MKSRIINLILGPIAFFLFIRAGIWAHNTIMARTLEDDFKPEPPTGPEIQAVHITLGDYFADRSSDNVYRIGFAIKTKELGPQVAIKLDFGKEITGNSFFQFDLFQFFHKLLKNFLNIF